MYHYHYIMNNSSFWEYYKILQKTCKIKKMLIACITKPFFLALHVVPYN